MNQSCRASRSRGAWILLVPTLLLPNCGLVEKRHLVGSYYLVAEDTPEQRKVVFNLKPGERQSHLRIDETIYAVGWDRRYIVAEQHLRNDRRIRRYYYLDISRDHEFATPSDSVVGPLTRTEFERKQAELGLPEFSLRIDPLE